MYAFLGNGRTKSGLSLPFSFGSRGPLKPEERSSDISSQADEKPLQVANVCGRSRDLERLRAIVFICALWSIDGIEGLLLPADCLLYPPSPCAPCETCSQRVDLPQCTLSVGHVTGICLLMLLTEPRTLN